MNPVPPLTTILMKFLLSGGTEQNDSLAHARAFAMSLSDIAVRYEVNEGGQMHGLTPRKTGGVFAGIRRGFFVAENIADVRPSFAAVEWSMSDRLLRMDSTLDGS